MYKTPKVTSLPWYHMIHRTHLLRLRRRRELGVRCNDGSPDAGARGRREARGIGTEVGVFEAGVGPVWTFVWNTSASCVHRSEYLSAREIDGKIGAATRDGRGGCVIFCQRTPLITPRF